MKKALYGLLITGLGIALYINQRTSTIKMLNERFEKGRTIIKEGFYEGRKVITIETTKKLEVQLGDRNIIKGYDNNNDGHIDDIFLAKPKDHPINKYATRNHLEKAIKMARPIRRIPYANRQ